MSDIFNKIVRNLKEGQKDHFVIEDDTNKNNATKEKKNIPSNVQYKNGDAIDKNGVKITHHEVASRVGYKMRLLFRDESLINEWTCRDFVLYIRKLYYNKYREDWGLNLPRAIMDFKKIEEVLEDTFNRCNPAFTKKYIDFFFEQWADILINKYQKFFLSFFEKKEVLESYYNYVESLRDGTLDTEGRIKLDVKEQVLSNDLIEASYSIGFDSLVYDYGIILSINWLILHKKIDKKEAATRVLKICKDAYRDNKFNMIERKTEILSPYPEWFVVKKIGPKVKADIKFENSEQVNSKYNFVRTLS